MKYKLILFCIAFILFFSFGSTAILAQSNKITELVSVSSSGEQGNQDSVGNSLISSSGRYVIFRSYASNLVPNDTNQTMDIFIHDRTTQTTELVSVSSSGIIGNSSSTFASISSDERYIAFVSTATNLISVDTNGTTPDIYIRDQVDRTTTCASLSTNNIQGNYGARDPSISGDGVYVAFDTLSNNLVPDDVNNKPDVFLRDLTNETLELISVSSAGVQGNGESHGASISTDGRFVAFYSSSNNLVPGDVNNAVDVFLRDRQNRTTELISVTSDNKQGNDVSSYPAISSDGNLVAFTSDATNLILGDTNSVRDILLRDRQKGTTERISVSSYGIQGNRLSDGPSFSKNGQYIVFYSDASNLVENDTNGSRDVFVYDRTNGAVERVSLANDYLEANDLSQSSSQNGSISLDGRFVVFYSAANNLVANDINNYWDVFVRDRGDGTKKYSLSGKVTDFSNHPISDVTISDNNGHETTTDSDGNFMFVDMLIGQYTFQATKEGYFFSPVTIQITESSNIQQNINFISQNLLFSINLPMIIR